MVSPFPQESVDLITKAVDRSISLYPHLSKMSTVARLYQLMRTTKGIAYGFTNSLLNGNYFPWPHEAQKENHGGVNCTSIVPYIFLLAQANGFKPHIVEFCNFSDDVRDRVSDTPAMAGAGHYSVIIPLEDGRRFLVDPAGGVFGQIIQETDSKIRTARYKEFSGMTRSFETLRYHSPQDFVALVEHLREEAGSLDMLISGQKVHNNIDVAGVSDCTLMAYYDDAENRITTRLYIPQVGISDKVIFSHTRFSDTGEVISTDFDLFTAKAYNWDSLIRPKIIGRVTLEDMLRLRKCTKEMRVKKHGRLGNQLLDLPSARKTALFELIQAIDARMSPAEKGAYQRNVSLRTLYEITDPAQEYVYTQEQHDAKVREAYDRYNHLEDEKRPFSRSIHRREWHLSDISDVELERIKRKKKKYDREINRVDQELSPLLAQRYFHPSVYRRTRDMVLFSQARKTVSDEELAREVIQQGSDERIGRVAMFADYAPFIIEGRKELELSAFLDSIKRKIRARHVKE